MANEMEKVIEEQKIITSDDKQQFEKVLDEVEEKEKNERELTEEELQQKKDNELFEAKVDLFLNWVYDIYDSVILYDEESERYYLDPGYMFVLNNIALKPEHLTVLNYTMEDLKENLRLQVERRNIKLDKSSRLFGKFYDILGDLNKSQMLEFLTDSVTKVQDQQIAKPGKIDFRIKH